ncbi:MAG: phospholipase D-like domain-containing protein [Pacificimonas sp.]
MGGLIDVTSTETGTIAAIEPGEERLDLLQEGSEAFDALMRLIASAKRDLRLLFYTFASDRCGRQVMDGLKAACERGVNVSLIVDDVGSLETDDGFFDPLEACGGRFREFQTNMLANYLLRNHQKMAIADGERAIVGSFNIADSHLAGSDPDSWRDIGVSIEGPAAARLAIYYDRLDDWMRSGNGKISALRKLIDESNEAEGDVRWVIGGPAIGRNHYARQVRREFAESSNVDLIMAYFTPTREVLKSVREQSRKGRLRLVSAGKTDVQMSRAAAWHTYSGLLKTGAEIYEYQPRLLHTKLIVTDNAVLIGSGNFDMRSLYINMEIMLRVERPDFHQDVRTMFEGELEDSVRIDRETLNARGHWYKRILWGVSYWTMVGLDGLLSKIFAR